MALRITRQEAPELSDEQAEELVNAWIPAEQAPPQGEAAVPRGRTKTPRDKAKDPQGGDLQGEVPPSSRAPLGGTQGKAKTLPEDLLRSMINQFVAFSQGIMTKTKTGS
jgi:hypothetical protein